METQNSENTFKDVVVKEEYSFETLPDPDEDVADDQEDVKDPELLQRIKAETSFEIDCSNKYIPQKCPVCCKVYTNYYILRNHMSSIHINWQEFSCSLCSRTFRKEESLKNHIRMSHECSFCGLMLADRAQKESHISRTHRRKTPIKIEKIKVEKSEKQTNSIKKIFDNEKEEDTKPMQIFFHPIKKKFQCGTCKEFFKKKENVFQHIIKDHETYKSTPRFTSNPVVNAFGNKPNGIEQGEPKKRLFPCQHCNKIFAKEGTLTKHIMQRHSNKAPQQKLFHCLSCPKKFKSESFLKSHTRNYCNGKLTCPICQHFCTDANSFFSHLRSHDIVVGSATQSTSTAQTLVKEEEPEELESTFNLEECLFCLEQFPAKEQLQEHIAQFHSEFCVESAKEPVVKTESEYILS